MTPAQTFWANREAQARSAFPRAIAAGYGAPPSSFGKSGGKQQTMSKGFGKKGRTAPFNTSPSRFSHSGTPMRPPGSSTTVRLPAPRPQSFQTFMKERYAGAMPKSQPLKKKEAVPEATIKDDDVT